MIDDPAQIEELRTRMRESLPLQAIVPPPLIALLRQQWPGREVPRHGRIVRVDYAGDEGGLMCQLELSGEGYPAVHVSLTQLVVAPGMPLARAIVKYQKRRIKRLRRQGCRPD